MKLIRVCTLVFVLSAATVASGQEPAVPSPEGEAAPSPDKTVATKTSNIFNQPSTVQPQQVPQPSGSGAAGTPVASLSDVRRIYVAPLTGGRGKDTLRDLIIASVSASHEFVVTENEERADAVLKGAADDEVFNEHFNTNDSTSVHGSLGLYGAAVKGAGRGPGGYLGESASEHSSSRDEERKHEAYAAVRLCNKDGDVIWSTTQESPGGKFRGAGADVAAKVARQLVIDLDKARRREFEAISTAADNGLVQGKAGGQPNKR